MAFTLDPARGDVNIALTFKMDWTKPYITIEKWVWDGVNGLMKGPAHHR